MFVKYAAPRSCIHAMHPYMTCLLQDLQPGHVRHQRILGRHQPAAGVHPRRRRLAPRARRRRRTANTHDRHALGRRQNRRWRHGVGVSRSISSDNRESDEYANTAAATARCCRQVVGAVEIVRSVLCSYLCDDSLCRHRFCRCCPYKTAAVNCDLLSHFAIHVVHVDWR